MFTDRKFIKFILITQLFNNIYDNKTQINKDLRIITTMQVFVYLRALFTALTGIHV